MTKRTFTNSERSAFHCQQKWLWQYGVGLRPVTEESHFLRGNIWHDAMDVYHNEGLEAARMHLEGLLAASKTQLLDTSSNATEEQQGEIVKQCMILLPDYHARYAGEWDVLHTEIELSTCIDEDRDLWWAGKVDKIVRTKEGKIYIVDHKTTTMDTSRWYEFNRYRPQMIGYALLAERELGINVDGIMYDVVCMPTVRSEEAPEATKAGVLRKYSSSLPNITPEAWQEGMERHNDFSDNAKDVLKRLQARKADDCEMARFDLPLTEDEKTRTLLELQNLTAAMKSRWEYVQEYRNVVHDARSLDSAAQRVYKEVAGSFPRNHSMCRMFNKLCDYASLCENGIIDNPMRLSGVHEELEGESNDL